ncbi:MAG TPA: hypothetical protein VLU25_05225 [Acidobacteriota bacterium]|nr:hypothetical protein [Acidobacteriota bacterium]
MSVPVLGTYESENGNFKIQITSANPSNGQIEGTYETNYSPKGGFKVSGKIGNYSWVAPAGNAPFVITFSVLRRPDGFPYAIRDTWTGAYQKGDTMWLDGSRSYINEAGNPQQVGGLGTLTFSM